MPAHTFVATAVPFARTGASLRWADIDPDTRVISAQSIASMITDKTKIIVVVHLYGLAADMDAIMSLAAKHNLIVVEDAAQAPGARYKAKRVGSIGDNRLGGWHSYRASKAALNQIMRNFAIELGRRNKGAVVVSLHPGTVETALSEPFSNNVPDGQMFTPDHSAQCLLSVIDGLEAKDNGGFFAWDGQPIEF